MEIELTEKTIYEYIVDKKNRIITICYLDGTEESKEWTEELECLIRDEMIKPFVRQNEEAKGPINEPALVFIQALVFGSCNKYAVTFNKTYFLVQDRKKETLKKSMDDFEEEINDIRNIPSIKTYTTVDDDYRYKHHSYSYVYKK